MQPLSGASEVASSRGPGPTWIRSLGAAEVIDGAVVRGGDLVVGSQSGPAGSSRNTFTLERLAPNGTRRWSKSNVIGNATLRRVVANEDAIYLVGSFTGVLQFGRHRLVESAEDARARADIFVAKFDLQGNVQWAKRFGSTFFDAAYGAALGPDGSLYLTGTFQENLQFGATTLDNAGIYDVFVAALDPSGKAQWALQLHTRGGTENRGNAIAVDPARHVWVTGQISGPARFGGRALAPIGSMDAFVLEISPTGQTLAASRFGGTRASGTAIAATGRRIVVGGDFDHRLEVSSSTLTSQGTRDAFAAVFDRSLEVRDVKAVGGSGWDHATAVAIADDESVTLSGQFEGRLLHPRPVVGGGKHDGFMLRVAADGNVRQLETLNGPAQDSFVVTSSQGPDVWLMGTFSGPRQRLEPSLPESPGGVALRLTPEQHVLTQERDAPGDRSPQVEVDRATESGDLDTVRRWVPEAVSATSRSGSLGRLLNVAAYHGHTDIACYLLHHGASADGSADETYPPLRQAARFGHLGVVRALVEGGVNLDSDAGRNALVSSMDEFGGHPEVTQFLLAQGVRVTGSTTSESPLRVAIGLGEPSLVRQLLDAGADLHDLGDGNSPLGWAATKGQPEIARLLLERGARAETPKDHPPLLAAAHSGHAEVVRLLLAAGADPDPADGRHGDTALMRASNGGHDEVVVMLLDAGANIHATDPKGLTALHFAARNGQLSTVQILVRRGASPAARDQAGLTPAEKATKSGHQGTARWLRENGSAG